MHLLLLGLNFKTAPVEIREKLHFPTENLAHALSLLKDYQTVKGCVILSTCNRVEIYVAVDSIEKGKQNLRDFIINYHGLDKTQILPFLYLKTNQDAVNHLFRVASGLDSMVLGEYQIISQIKTAYQSAYSLGFTNNLLNKLFQTALQTAKKVRTETNIGFGSVSVATMAVEAVKQFFSHYKELNILLIGAGKMSKLAAANFQQKHSSCKLTITNRTLENCQELVQQFKAQTLDYQSRILNLTRFDAILVSTSANDYVLTNQQITDSELVFERPTLFIDLSMPRNIDPSISSIPNCKVFSIDDINNQIVTTLDKRSKEIPKVETIIRETSELYFKWYVRSC